MASKSHLLPYYKDMIKQIVGVRDRIPPTLSYYKHPRYILPVLRHMNCLTQRELASRAKVSPNQIALIEKGRASPTVETLEKLFYALWCDLVLVPKLRIFPEAMLEKRAAERARKWARRTRKTRGASKDEIERLIKAHTASLLESPIMRLWDD